jgi:hypothetical protein
MLLPQSALASKVHFSTLAAPLAAFPLYLHCLAPQAALPLKRNAVLAGCSLRQTAALPTRIAS